MNPFPAGPVWERCPKCDILPDEPWTSAYHEYAHESSWSGSFPPTHQEHLCWLCLTCGYAIQTACADVKVPVTA